ncbi:MAG: CDP-diacylglycerol--serine O-phosphatidyltransferase [Planctomycetes bacterium]|nr:CDP-diacylglycerol--serine O-phosphatidyltransferase [Planctomycetota bacterium]
MKILRISVLPSLLTLGNAICGFLSIAYVADGRFVNAAWMIFAAMLFDALDGKVARMTGGTSDFGMQLDSLADVITFGVAPAFLVKVLVQSPHSPYHSKIAWGLSVLFVLCAALRLARFNVETARHDDDSHSSFRGLPSPAAAGSVASLVILYDFLDQRQVILLLLPPVTVLLGALMISRFRYVHAFNKVVRGGKSFAQLAQIVFLLIFAAILPEIAFATLFLGFSLSGPARTIWRLLHRKAAVETEDEEAPSTEAEVGR